MNSAPSRENAPDWQKNARFIISMSTAVVLIIAGVFNSDLALLTLGVGLAGLPSYINATE